MRRALIGFAILLITLLCDIRPARAQALSRILPQVNFAGVALNDAIDYIRDVTGPDFNLASQDSGGGRGGRGGGNIISSNGNGNDTEQKMTRAERAQALIDVITSTIQPDIWQVNGGTAAIRFFNGNLIVTAPRSVHEALGD